MIWQGRHWLAPNVAEGPAAEAVEHDRFIEIPNGAGLIILLTVRSDERQQGIRLQTTSVTLGTMEMNIGNGNHNVIFDIDKNKRVLVNSTNLALNK